jgi:diguanylate cyclase (GGDEF)-like protein
MLSFPIPGNEERRINALREIKIVGSDPSTEFDALVQLAGTIFDCPIALVSFIEQDYQWFKARHGTKCASTPREFAFCNYTISTGKVFVVSDAKRDKRFKENPYVAGTPGVRFYAGCPISIDGENNIGTLCIVDFKPRRLSSRQKEKLTQLARAVEALVKAHQNEIRAKSAAALAMEQTRVAETSNRLLLQIEKFAGIGAWRLDLETSTPTWSDEVFRLHDLPLGQTPSLDQALGFYPGASRDIVVKSIERTVTTGAPYLIETDFVTASGRNRRVRAMGELESKDGAPKTLIGVFEDVTHRHEVEQRLWKLAYVDSLSEIANRSQFQQHFTAKLAEAKSKETELSLLLLDLDGFKEVNDTMGHHAGDEVIKAVAQRIAAVSGRKAFCARLGGDEFAILASIKSAAARKRLADRILTAVRKPIPIGDQQAFVSGSIGIARFPGDGTTTSGILKAADMALYQAKKAGAGSVGVFSPDIGGIFDARRLAIDTVKRAGMARRIVPFYQPKVCLATRRVYGFEALVRIKNADGSIIGPQDFWHAFADAECSRLINQHMLRAITEDMAEWTAAGLDPGVVSINASEFCFQDGDYAERILSRLEEMGVPPEKFEIEITETVFLGESAKLVETALTTLKEAGCSIALDDFGTGYASLTHLRDFPINHIKIDRSFVLDLIAHSHSTVIVKAIVDLAHNLGMHVVAEGVESEAQYEFLRAIGCDSGQGYLFGRAVPAHAAVEHLGGDRVQRLLHA